MEALALTGKHKPGGNRAERRNLKRMHRIAGRGNARSKHYHLDAGEVAQRMPFVGKTPVIKI